MCTCMAQFYAELLLLQGGAERAGEAPPSAAPQTVRRAPLPDRRGTERDRRAQPLRRG